jgi:glycolate oxidase FAD binding subunit
MAVFHVMDAKQASDAVTWAVAEQQPLEILGGGSKRGIGRPVRTEHALDLSGLSGIIDYEAAELVLTAAAGTPLAEIEAALGAQHQMLAFEPADWRRLLGAEASTPTIGGTLSCNLAGPRRIKAGAARDHFLGYRAVNGRGEQYKAGGKVVKNVTGYDLCKLIAGALGTLSVLTEITVKVMPRPETARTILVHRSDDAGWQDVLAEGLNSPHEVSGAAYLPSAIARRSQVAVVSGARAGVAALRIEGPEPSTAYRGLELVDMLSGYGPTAILDTDDTDLLWRELRDATLLVEPRDRFVWRISVTPSAGPSVAADISQRAEAECYFDWAGGLVWVAVDAGAADAAAEVVRLAIATHGGGHGTLLRAPENLRAAVSVFEPLPGPLAALSARVKEGFDPRRVLNPGRMYASV